MASHKKLHPDSNIVPRGKSPQEERLLEDGTHRKACSLHGANKRFLQDTLLHPGPALIKNEVFFNDILNCGEYRTINLTNFLNEPKNLPQQTQGRVQKQKEPQ